MKDVSHICGNMQTTQGSFTAGCPGHMHSNTFKHSAAFFASKNLLSLWKSWKHLTLSDEGVLMRRLSVYWTSVSCRLFFFLDAVASLGFMLETDKVMFLRFCQILGISSAYHQHIFRLSSGFHQAIFRVSSGYLQVILRLS